MPASDRDIELSNGIIALSKFNGVRHAEQRYSRTAHLYITAVCIRTDSAVNPIRFKKRSARSWLDYQLHSEWSRWEAGHGQSSTVVEMATARREIPTPRRTLDASPAADAVALLTSD